MAGADIHTYDELQHSSKLQSSLSLFQFEFKQNHAPLHYAAHHNHHDVVTMVQGLCDRNEQPTQMLQSFLEFALNKPTLGQELLLAAAGNPNVDVLRMLISTGASVNTRDQNDRTPLHVAAGFNPNADMIRALTEAGADVDALDNVGQTPLHKAAERNTSAEVIKALVDAGADVEAADRPQLTLNQVKVFRQMIFPQHVTPLHMAARSNPTMVDTLLECKAEVDPKDDHFCTPLYYAAANNHSGAVISLCKAGANPRLSPKAMVNVTSEMKNLIKEHTH